MAENKSNNNNNNNNNNAHVSLGVGIFLVFSVIGVVAMMIVLIYLAFIQGQQNEAILTGVRNAQLQNNEILEGVQNATEQNSAILRNIEQLTNDIFIMQKVEVQSSQAARQIVEVLLANKNITIPEELRKQLLIAPQASSPS